MIADLCDPNRLSVSSLSSVICLLRIIKCLTCFKNYSTAFFRFDSGTLNFVAYNNFTYNMYRVFAVIKMPTTFERIQLSCEISSSSKQWPADETMPSPLTLKPRPTSKIETVGIGSSLTKLLDGKNMMINRYMYKLFRHLFMAYR